MNTMIDFAHAHPFFLVGALWVYSAAVGAMDAPTATSKPFYRWFFKFNNTVAANLARAFTTKVENSPNFLPAVDLHNNRQVGPNLIGDTPNEPK